MWSPLSTLLILVLVLLLTGLGYVLTRARPIAARDWKADRARMVEAQLEARGVEDPRVLEAMRTVPRHRFVPAAYREHAYEDRPLPIGRGQTISQPYIVAVMTELLELEPGDRVLEVGTGSGYQAAVLSELVDQVYSIEIVPELAERARTLLAADGYEDVAVITGDGYRGLPEQAPFDGIIVTAAPAEIPKPLLEQLDLGGCLVIPVGGRSQWLKVVERTETGFETKTMFEVRFVPMTGEAETRD
jgi:protein-L-isoaspartate(D-aspartate) O-methyltransferase